MRSRSVLVAALVVGGLAVAGCGDDPPKNSESAYCAAARENAAALTSPALVTSDDISDNVKLYEQMHGVAPLAIEPEWAAMAALMRAARDLDPADSAAAATFATQARETKMAADRVIIYTQQKCQVQIGDTPVVSMPLVPTTVADSVPGVSTETSAPTSG
ncbi:MAG TPA: hypothetical protein PKV27_09745 [Ilumatobacteraceae bacterium]|nr:hypothetical protein [Ilumatobacteraceae bacterium]